MIAAELVEWRTARGKSQEQLALALGVSRVTIARWETGQRRLPGALLILALLVLDKHPELWEGGAALPR